MDLNVDRLTDNNFLLTNETSGSLLCDFYTKGTGCDRFVTIAVNGDLFGSVKQFVGSAVVLPFSLLT